MFVTLAELGLDFSRCCSVIKLVLHVRKSLNLKRSLSICPLFGFLVVSTVQPERTGFVFNPVPSRVALHERATGETASKTILRIGKAAGVVVDKKDDKAPYASAHDLRRAFGFRWSRRVMPAVLKELMRHADIGTTMKFYVGTQAEATAEMLYQAIEVGDGRDSRSGSRNSISIS